MFITEQNRNWVFAAKVIAPNGNPINVALVVASNTAIRRHVKIKRTANPFDPKEEIYFENRLDWKLKKIFDRKKETCTALG